MNFLKFLFITIQFLQIFHCKLLDTSNEILSRQKRYLVWKEDVSWVQMIVGIGLPIEIKDQSITLGSVVKAFYVLPINSSIFVHPSIELLVRKKRSSTRWAVYNLIENFLEHSGYADGKSCLLKSICEVASIPFDKKSGVLTEIVHAILTPSSTEEMLENYFNTEYLAAEKLGRNSNNCSALYQECEYNLVEQFTKYLF